jgi:hypothetical protein
MKNTLLVCGEHSSVNQIVSQSRVIYLVMLHPFFD